jgi:hypothetical protein
MSLSRASRQYLGVRSVSPPTLQLALRAPTSADKSYVKGTLWLDTDSSTSFMWPGTGDWISLGSGTTGAIVTLTGGTGGALSPTAGNMNLLGTANQITSTGSGSTITLSIPAAFTAPGSIVATTTIESTTTMTAGTGLTVTTGNLVASAGNISATLGSITAATTLTATLGAITATNGNLVLGTAGNKILSTSVASTTAAGANSFGKVTLVDGTATVSTTSVTANSIILLTRQGVGATGANALGGLSVGTIVASTSFVINAWSQANATVLETTDVSSIGWMIVN